MMRLIAAVLALFGFAAPAPAQVIFGNNVEMSILPAARSAVTGQDVTFFATLLSTDAEDLTCEPSPALIIGLPAGVSGTLSVFALDGALAIEGARNAAFTLPAGGRRDLLVTFNIAQPMQGEVELSIACRDPANNFEIPRTYRGVNTFTLTVTDAPGPDIVMIGDTISRDGVARVGADGPRAALLTVAAVNIGAAGGPFEVHPDITGFSMLRRLGLSICELDAGANCLAPRSDHVTVNTWANGEVRLFGVFAPVPGFMGLAFWPDLLRLQATVVTPVAATPAPDLSAPASSHREAPIFAQTSSAIAVERAGVWTVFVSQNPDAFYPAYQCHNRHDQDTTGRFANVGGILIPLRDPQGDPGTGTIDILSYIWTRDRSREPYPQPIRFAQFDLLDPAPASTSLDLLGVGVDDRQPVDSSIPATAQLTDGVSFVFDWAGNSGLENDFFADGRARCAAIPPAPDLARTPEGAPARTEATLDGRYAPPPPLLPAVNPNQDANTPMLVVNEGLISNPTGLAGVLLAQLSQARSLDPDAPGDIDILDAFAGFFAHLGTSGGSSTGADAPLANGGDPVGFTLIANPADLATIDGPPGCLVIMAFDGDVADVNAALDADANIMIFAATPEGEPVPEVTLEDCLP